MLENEILLISLPAVLGERCDIIFLGNSIQMRLKSANIRDIISGIDAGKISLETLCYYVMSHKAWASFTDG